MRKGLLGSLMALAATAGLAWGQPPRGGSPMVDPMPAPGGSSIEQLHQPRLAGDLPPGYMAGPDGYGPGLFGMIGQPGPEGYYIERTWASFEYLLWKMRNGPSNWPLAVEGTILNGVDPFAPGSVTLLGGRELRWDMSNGARFTVGAWLPGSTKVGIEASGTIFEVKPIRRGQVSSPLGIPVLGTPFINEISGLTDSVFAAFPLSGGQISALAKTQLWKTELSVVGNLSRTMFFHANIVGGVQHLGLQEEISVIMNSPANPNGFFLGAVDRSPIATEDRFTTRNWFYGGHLGLALQYRFRSLTFDWDSKLALGVMHRILDVNGYTQSGVGAAAVRAAGGVLAGVTNIGQRTDNEFAAVPHMKLGMGWQALQWLRFNYGVDFLYATSVLRPGDQIDPVVNPALIPLRPEFGTAVGTARPTQLRVQSDFWAIGVSFGMTLRY